MIRKISAALDHKRAALGQKEKGFTLIELLVVVIIIGILAAIAIPIFLGQQAQARDSAVESAITNAKTAVVASLVGGTPLPADAAPMTAGTVAGYTPSTEITVSFDSTGTAAAPAFTITGVWGTAVATPSAANHGHTISDTGAAVKVP